MFMLILCRNSHSVGSSQIATLKSVVEVLSKVAGLEPEK